MVKTLVGGKKKTTNSLAESMMNDFIKEGFVQQEFDFDEPKYVPENPDDYKQEMMEIAVDAYEERAAEEKWFPVYDAIEAAKAKTAHIKSVDGGIDTLASFSGDLPAVSTWQDGDAVMVSERRVIVDPLDSDLYEKHFDMLGQIAANMPKGFEADFDCTPGKQSKYIGNKYIVTKEESRNSDQTGVEMYIVYDAIETLRILPAQGEVKEHVEINEDELDDDAIEVDFPAWALDYWVNAELGSVSRQEQDQIEAWCHMIELNGFDTNMIDFGKDEYFSSSPEFGLPCDCVTAKIAPKAKTLDESSNSQVKVLCVSGAEFEDDYTEQRAWASREGMDAVEEEIAKDWAKADSFRFPVYSNIKFPASMAAWFDDPELFEVHRGEIEEYAIPVWNSLNGFRFVKAVSLDFEDATADVLSESENEFDPVTRYLC